MPEEVVQSAGNARILFIQDCAPAAGGFKAAAESEAAGRKNLFWKEIFHAGTYAHPQDQSKTMVVDEERMRGWMKNFAAGRMQKVMATYEHPENGKDLIHDAHGEVLDLKIEGSGMDASLSALVSLDDEAAGKVRAGLLYSVSVGLVRRKDKHGNDIGEFLHHLALTNDPYLNDLEPFELAASADGTIESAVRERMVRMEAAGKTDERLSTMGHRALGDAYRGFRAMDDKAMMDAAENEIERRYKAARPGRDYPGADAACMELSVMEGPFMSAEDKGNAEDAAKLVAKVEELNASFAASKNENAELKKQIANFQADLARVTAFSELQREKAEKAEISALSSRVEGWEKAPFALSKAEAPRVLAILSAARKHDDVVEFSVGDKTDKGKIYDLLCAFMDNVTQHGLQDNRRLAGKQAGVVVAEGHEDANADKTGPELVNEFCAKKGYKTFDFSNGKLNDTESARFKKVNSEMVRSGFVKYEAARPISS